MPTLSIREEIRYISDRVRYCKEGFHHIRFHGHEWGWKHNGYSKKDVEEFLEDLNDSHLIPNPLSMNLLLNYDFIKAEHKASLISGIKYFIDGLEDISSVAVVALYLNTQNKVNKKYGITEPHDNDFSSKILGAGLFTERGKIGRRMESELNEKMMKESPFSQSEFKKMFEVSGYMETLTGENQNYKRKDLNLICKKLKKNGIEKTADILREIIEAKITKSNHPTQDGPGI